MALAEPLDNRIATRFVPLAILGSRPQRNIRAGNVRNEPPPAIVLTIPATKPAGTSSRYQIQSGTPSIQFIPSQLIGAIQDHQRRPKFSTRKQKDNAAAGRNQTENSKSEYRNPKQIRNPKNQNLRCRQNHRHGPHTATHHAACHSVLRFPSLLPFLPNSSHLNLFGIFCISCFELRIFFQTFAHRARMFQANT